MITGFYTSIEKQSNFLLYRGYNHEGNKVKQKVKFKPTYYLDSKHPNSKYQGLDRAPIEPMTFNSMSEANEFSKTYNGVSTFKIYGNPRHVPAFIQTQFPNEISFKRELIDIGNIDIETSFGDGFPDCNNPTNQILTIAYKSSKDDTYRVWGLKPYDETQSQLNVKIDYMQFASEEKMLLHFIDWWSNPENTPDVITGWNTRFFDIPYMVARMTHLVGEANTKRLSPWGNIRVGEVTIMGNSQQVVSISGVAQLDYMDLFKKFAYTYGNQESYSLNHIASVVLGEKKLDYSEVGSLRNLYDADYQMFVDYNIKDVELIERFEEKMGLITLVITTAYIGGVNYTDTLGTTAIWDSIIYRRLMRQRTVPRLHQLPASDYKIKSGTKSIAGGYVKDVVQGMSEWVMSFDLNSLYPNIIIQNNMSPETLIPYSFVENVVPEVLLGTDKKAPDGVSMAGNGSVYRKDVKGIIPEIVEELYVKRVEIKERTIEFKKQLAKDESNQALIREVTRNETLQMAVKILLNSLYGAIANEHFRYYDPQVAEGVTLTGQTVIRTAEKAVNEEICKFLKQSEVKDRVIAIDTDSVYITAKDIIDKFNPKEPVNFLDEFGTRVIEPALNRAFDTYAKKTGAYDNRMVMKREAIADRGIWTAKKRYILNVHNNEGVQYAEPKIKMMGIEAIKSSTPQVCREAMKHIFKVIMTGSEEKTQEAIALFKEHFKTLSPDLIAFPRGVSDVNKWIDKNTIYSKGTPMHVRASLLHNHHVKKNGLDKEYELIYSGDKIKYIHLMTPNPIKENVFGFKERYPDELGLNKYINYELQFRKSFIEPLNMILKTLNWTDEKVVSLQDFFC
jgi:DNA polymerase elongation subunit (family B)